MRTVKVFNKNNVNLQNFIKGKRIKEIDYSINVPLFDNSIDIYFDDDSYFSVYALLRIIYRGQIILCSTDFYFTKNFIEDDKYDYIIKTAVLNHNKGKIDEGLSEKEMLFSKIIRDADKLDIINNILLIEDFKIVFWFDNFDISEISEYAMKTMENRTLLNYEYVKNNADQIVVFYAYIFDLYFDISLKIVAKEKSLEKYTEIIKKKFTSLQVHKQSDRILEICYKYFKDKKVI